MSLSRNLADFATDARYALRAVRKDLSLFVFAASIIGIGIGACTAVFSVLSPLMIRDLPFTEPERLVWIANDGERGNMSAVTSRSSNLRDFRAQSESFDGITGYFAFFEAMGTNLVGEGEPERLVGVPVAWDFLDVLGVDPVVGRNFVEEEGAWGGPDVVLLTHDFWQRRFAGDESIVGQTLDLDDDPHLVAGVLPASFDFASIFAPHTRIDFLGTFPIADETDRWGNTLALIGRLAPGATVASAQAELDVIIDGLERDDPERWGLGAVVTGLRDEISGPFRSAMGLLAAAALAVMLIVCVNLSNLLLARGRRRQNEMAVRSALGASRARLTRQLLFESLLLSTSGAALGLLLAQSAIRFVRRSQAVDIPLLETVSLDASALLFTTLLAVIVGLVIGLVPALRITRREAAIVRGSGRGATDSRSGTLARELLVVGEIALACVLLVVGGLLLQSFRNVLEVDLGFQASEVSAWQLSTSREFETPAETAAYFDTLVEQVSQAPGVQAAGLADAIPLGRNRSWGIGVPGVDYDGKQFLEAFPHIVDHRYLETLRVPLLEGRHFTTGDTAETEQVVILNQSAAREVFRGDPAVGRTLTVGGGDNMRVVGVVADIRHVSLEKDAGLQVYMPYAQGWHFGSIELVVRSDLELETLAPTVVRAIHDHDPTIPARDFRSFDAVVARAVSPRRFTLQFLSAFSTTALLLAALGIYGVLSYSVAERVREIGIRMALGETGPGVMRKILGRTLLLTAIGMGLGMAGAILATRWTQSLLFGVQPMDVSTLASAGLVLVGVAAVAGWVPAWKASRTNVVDVLKNA